MMCLALFALSLQGSQWHSTMINFGENMWVFPKIGVPQNGWFIMENPIKMDDLGVPPFRKHPCNKKVLNSWSFAWFFPRFKKVAKRCRDQSLGRIAGWKVVGTYEYLKNLSLSLYIDIFT